MNLKEIFEAQTKLMDAMGWPGGKGQAGFRMHIQAAHVELDEALCESNWKPWKTDFDEPMTDVQHELCQVELTDTIQFIVNAAMCLGYTAEDLSTSLQAKLVENHRRIEAGEVTNGSS